MGRCDRRHGRHHKSAIVHAHEELGLTADQIVTLAAAGKLKDPDTGRLLASFSVAPSTIRNYCQWARRRERRAATNGGHDEGPVPNDAVTVPKLQTETGPSPQELAPVTWEKEHSQALEDSPLLQRLLELGLGGEDPRAAESGGDTAPPPPPD